MPLSDLVFLRGQYVPRCRHDINKHFEDYSTLQLSSGGAVALSIADESWLLEGKWFWSAWPGPRVSFHAAKAGGWWVHGFVAFRGPAADRWTKEGLFPVRPQQPPSRRNAAAAFDTMLRLSRSANPWARRKAVHLLEGILIDLAAARRDVRPTSHLAPVLQRLREASHSSDVNYAAVAGDEGMSERTLRRQLHKSLGVSPHEYVLAQRMQSARQLLSDTDLPVKEVARRLGYRDVFYFTRQFTQRTGVSPALYRRSWEG
jgi:AraC-like DNA-binding protein